VVIVLNRNPGNKTAKNIAPSATLNISESEPISLNKLSRDSGDYSTVIDAIETSSSIRTQSVSKKCPPLHKHSKKTSQSSEVHPFSKTGATNCSSINKAANHKRPPRVAPPIPLASRRDNDPQPIGELEHSYAHIIDGLSPPDDAETARTLDSKSLAHEAARKVLFVTPHNTTNDPKTKTTTEEQTDKETYVYSSPIPGGMKNYRRMTASKINDATPNGATITKEYTRPQSALGLYPPLDDIYTSSCNSSPSSTRKKIDKSRPVSEYIL